jgi:hypothetical protein
MDEEERIQIGGEVDRLVEALDTERFRHVTGLEPSPALTPLFQGAPRAAHRATAQRLREAGEAALGARVAALRAQRVQAEAEEAWRAAESAVGAHGPSGRISLVEAERALADEADPERRASLARAAADACEEAAPAREAAVEAGARARAEVGLAPDWSAVVEGDSVLHESDDAWHDVVAWSVRLPPEGGPSPGAMARADLLRVLGLHRWSGLFRRALLPLAIRATLPPLRLDPGRVRVDDEERPAKWSGVHVFGTRVSFRARGGAPDWLDLLDGLGRALAASHQPPRLRDAAFGHAVGWLLSSLLFEPRWLAERCGVERREAPDLVRALRLRRLFSLRARAAALRVAAEVERGTSGRAWRDGYREAMTSALGARWDEVRAARDADAQAHQAALAGAGLGEALRLAIVERFDEDWWRNPRTSHHLAALLAAGGMPEDPAATPALAARTLSAAMAGR